MRFNIVVFPHPDGPSMAVNVLGENFPEHYLRILFFPSTSVFYPSTIFSSLTLAMTLMF
jgi:hypothetical protein